MEIELERSEWEKNWQIQTNVSMCIYNFELGGLSSNNRIIFMSNFRKTTYQ